MEAVPKDRFERATIIEVARKAARMTQTQLAVAASTSQSSISEYERRRKSPTLDVTERLMWATGVDLGMVTLVRFATRLGPDGREFVTADRLWRVEAPGCFARLYLPDVTGGTRQREWNLANRGERIRAYEILLIWGSQSQIFASVDGALLVDAWEHLALPDHIREAWAPLIAAAQPPRDRGSST